MASHRLGRAAARFSIVALALLSLGLSAPGCGRKREDAKNPVVARVGDMEIRRWDFVSAVDRAPRNTWPTLDSLDHAGRVDFVKTMVSKRLLVMEAEKRYQVMPPDQEYVVRKAEHDIALSVLANELVPPVRRPSGSQLEDCRQLLSRGYRFFTLLLDNEARARQIASSQWTDQSFNDLVRTETLDMNVEQSLGKTFLMEGPATSFVPEALPDLEKARDGSILGPYRQEEGWTLYRISKVTAMPDSVLADTTGLADGCQKIEQGLAIHEATNRLFKEANNTFDDANIAWLQKLYSTQLRAVHDSLKGEILLHKELLIPALGESDRARELAKILGEPFTAGQFLDEMKIRPINDYPSILHRGSIRLLVEEIAVDRVLWREAERRGIPKRAEVVEAVKRKRADVSLAYMIDVVLYDEAAKKVTEDQFRKLYTENPDKFMTRGKINLACIYLNDFQLAAKLNTRLYRGEDFKTVAADAKRADRSAEIVPSTGMFDYRQNAELYDLGREIAVGSSTGPVRMKNGRLVVYKVLDHGPPELKPFEEVRDEIVRSVTFLERDKMIDELVTSLQKTYPVEIHEDKL